MAHKVELFSLVLTSFYPNNLMSSLCFIVLKKKGMASGPSTCAKQMTAKDKLLPFEWWEEGQDVLEADGSSWREARDM